MEVLLTLDGGVPMHRAAVAADCVGVRLSVGRGCVSMLVHGGVRAVGGQ